MLIRSSLGIEAASFEFLVQASTGAEDKPNDGDHMTIRNIRLSRSGALALALQVGGACLLCIGAERNIPLYACGMLLLLPGSLIAMEIPIHMIGSPHFLSLHGMDGYDVESLAYLPVCILLNYICFLIIRRFLLRRWVRVSK